MTPLKRDKDGGQVTDGMFPVTADKLPTGARWQAARHASAEVSAREHLFQNLFRALLDSEEFASNRPPGEGG